MSVMSRGRMRSELVHIVRFVSIVWAIALSLQFVMIGSANLFSAFSNTDLVPAELSLPNVQTDCSAASLSAGTAHADAGPSAYYLGFKLGFATAIRNAGGDPAAYLEETRENSMQLAAALRVPVPTPPPVGHTTEVLHEFEVFLQADPQCIASLLERAYSPKSAALYRFGASFAHALYYRSIAPQLNPLFVPQLRVYGKAAELPEPLWLPLLQDLSQLSPEAAHAHGSAVAAAIEQHLAQAK